jgi:hypothetical protein
VAQAHAPPLQEEIRFLMAIVAISLPTLQGSATTGELGRQVCWQDKAGTHQLAARLYGEDSPLDQHDKKLDQRHPHHPDVQANLDSLTPAAGVTLVNQSHGVIP